VPKSKQQQHIKPANAPSAGNKGTLNPQPRKEQHTINLGADSKLDETDLPKIEELIGSIKV
jgi:hypothetical protein